MNGGSRAAAAVLGAAPAWLPGAAVHPGRRAIAAAQPPYAPRALPAPVTGPISACPLPRAAGQARCSAAYYDGKLWQRFGNATCGGARNGVAPDNVGAGGANEVEQTRGEQRNQ